MASQSGRTPEAQMPEMPAPHIVSAGAIERERRQSEARVPQAAMSATSNYTKRTPRRCRPLAGLFDLGVSAAQRLFDPKSGVLRGVCARVITDGNDGNSGKFKQLRGVTWKTATQVRRDMRRIRGV